MEPKQKDFGAIKDISLQPHHWVNRYADYLYSYALARLNNEELAKDLVQETFLAALEKINQFRGASTERTWLTAILKHKVIDVYRKKASRLIAETTIIDTEKEERELFHSEYGHWNRPHQPQSFGIEDQDPLSRKEFTQILRLCMKKLPALWLSVFTMKHMDDEATETICTSLKVSPSNFWVIIHRTKLNLRACLQKNWI